MTNIQALNPVEANALMRVDKTDGRTMFYRVTDGTHTQITEDEYNRENGA